MTVKLVSGRQTFEELSDFLKSMPAHQLHDSTTHDFAEELRLACGMLSKDVNVDDEWELFYAGKEKRYARILFKDIWNCVQNKLGYGDTEAVLEPWWYEMDQWLKEWNCRNFKL